MITDDPEAQKTDTAMGLRVARGVMYALAISAAMVLAVLAIMWWAL